MTIYLRIQPYGSSADDLRVEGYVISRHRTLEGAARAEVREQRRCTRVNGPNAWVDRNVVVDMGHARRELTGDEGDQFWGEVQRLRAGR